MGVTSRNFSTLPRNVPRGTGVQVGTILGKARPLKFGRVKFGAISDNFRLWSRISPERIDLSKIGKVLDQLQPLPRRPKKRWWTLVHEQKIIGAHVDPPKLNISTDYIWALRGCWPLKFLHALEIDQGLLAHIHNGIGGPRKKFNGEHVKLGLKFRVCAPITLRLVGVTSRNFSTQRAARQGCWRGHNFRGSPAP